ncbi:MAG TPA: hypothetical protein VGN12_17365 [Pirellulales bacterium]|jgi:hypothetical protein
MRKTVALLALILNWAAAPLSAFEPVSTDSIFGKWAKASRDLNSWDAHFTRFNYDPTFNSNGRRESGRFYWNETGQAFYTIEGRDTIAWERGALLVLDHRHKTYMRVTAREILLAKTYVDQLATMSTIQQWLTAFDIHSFVAANLGSMDDVLPLCSRIDEREVQERFQLSCDVRDDTIFVTAVPKHAQDGDRYRQIDVQLSRDNYRVLAHRVTKPDRTSTVHVFEDACMNETRDDVDAHLHPLLIGFRAQFESTGDDGPDIQ